MYGNSKLFPELRELDEWFIQALYNYCRPIYKKNIN